LQEEGFDRIVDPHEFVAVEHARALELRTRRQRSARTITGWPAVQRRLIHAVPRARTAQQRLVVAGDEAVERAVVIG
jgi:hypothetical protein